MNDLDPLPKGPNPIIAMAIIALLWVVFGLHACTASAGVVYVKDDMGGPVEERMREVDDLRRSGAIVRIDGLCISACTLYLGLPETCVGRSAVFGFHGPAARTRGLGPPLDEFERISVAMAQYYPERIRSWYLSTARYLIGSYYPVSGATLIAMGAVDECY